MKKFFMQINVIVLIFTLFFSSISRAQNEKSFASLGYKTVMSRLFETNVFTSNKEALWKPNYSEMIMMPVSDDGYCHTTMDTIMYFSDMNNKYATIIFATYEYIGDSRPSCHACSPTLGIAIFVNRNGKYWEIAQFEKNLTKCGSWGKKDGNFSIVKMGENRFCLNLKSAIGGNQGYVNGNSSFYTLDEYSRFRKVFSFVYYDSSVGAKVNEQGRIIEKFLKLLSSKDDYYTIELTTKCTNPKFIKKSTYDYSYELGIYNQKVSQ